MLSPKVLIGCEESQEVTKAFRALGIEAYSCDTQECSGGHPEWHYKDDIFHRLHKEHISLDFLGAHPPCTYSANSGVRWLYNTDGTKNEDRWEKMRKGAIFTRSLLHWIKTIGHGYIEQPILHKHALEIIGEKPTQIIQPWMFGHGETKATCLWVVGLPKLTWSNDDTLFQNKTAVEGREQRIHRMPPGVNRSKQRSKTYEGIAKAMADQWGNYVMQKSKIDVHI